MLKGWSQTNRIATWSQPNGASNPHAIDDRCIAVPLGYRPLICSLRESHYPMNLPVPSSPSLYLSLSVSPSLDRTVFNVSCGGEGDAELLVSHSRSSGAVGATAVAQGAADVPHVITRLTRRRTGKREGRVTKKKREKKKRKKKEKRGNKWVRLSRAKEACQELSARVRTYPPMARSVCTFSRTPTSMKS